VAVVIAFFVCYAPLYLQRLLSAIMVLNSNLNSDSVAFSNMMAYLFIISGMTFYFGSVINPILYNVVSNKYRRAFRDLFFCRFTYIKKTTTKNQRKLNNQPIHYFIKTPPTLQQLNDIDENVCLHSCQQQHMNNTLPMVKCLGLSSTPSSRSNSSSVSSQKREQYQTYCLRSNTSLSKKMSSIQIHKPFSGKKTT
jgi:ABC-type multidrug transport system fused ATPase/permease subunit